MKKHTKIANFVISVLTNNLSQQEQELLSVGDVQQTLQKWISRVPSFIFKCTYLTINIERGTNITIEIGNLKGEYMRTYININKAL